MANEIRHRRLHAFYTSLALNWMIIAAVVVLMLSRNEQSLAIPVVCASLALAFFIAYTLWLWIAKPRSIMVSRRLSTACSFFVYYFLIVVCARAENPWWYAAPAIAAIILLFVETTKPSATRFDI